VSQHWSPAPDSAEIITATARLLDTARTLSDADVLAPSLLPGWSRGHVLSHVARNADGLVNLLHWAATGVEHPQYADSGARDAAIEAGAGRPVAEQVTDIEQGHRRFIDAVDLVPAENWENEVRWVAGDPRPARKILESRIREVVIHHVDLDAGYSASDWPSALAFRVLASVVPAFEKRQMTPVTLLPSDVDAQVTVSGGSAIEVRGRAHQLATWMLGRDSGADLEWTGARTLPKPPAWT
jgi:maleylpyruvate isomerase